MDGPARVAMVMREFHPLTGGYQNQALRLAREMVRRGLRVDVVTQRRGGLAREEVHEQIRIHRVFALGDGYGHLKGLSYLISSFLWMARNRGEFDLLHANRSSSGLIAGLVGFALRKKVLYKLTRGDEIRVKGLGTTPWGRLKMFFLKLTVDRFVAITAKIEEDLKGLGVSPERIVRIHNGIRLEPIPSSPDPGTIKAEIGWGPETRVATFVGRLEHAKGVDWLLESWRRVAREVPESRLLVVGDGTERSALEARARASCVSGSVAFVGRRSDVARFLAITDVFVLPSRLEGVSNSLLEAMARGLPVVAGDDVLGGNREVIDDGADGVLVTAGDDHALAEALVKLLRDPALRAKIGRLARRKVEERFSMERVTNRYCELYEELLASPRDRT